MGTGDLRMSSTATTQICNNMYHMGVPLCYLSAKSRTLEQETPALLAVVCHANRGVHDNGHVKK